jgi:hypothetical protein
MIRQILRSESTMQSVTGTAVNAPSTTARSMAHTCTLNVGGARFNDRRCKTVVDFDITVVAPIRELLYKCREGIARRHLEPTTLHITSHFLRTTPTTEPVPIRRHRRDERGHRGE